MTNDEEGVEVEKLKLLIVEDDADQRELIREILADHFGSVEVFGATTGRAALAKDLGSFDLILMDYNLPDSRGMELLEKINQRCDTPVIMVTGENVSRIAAEAIRKGATDYVVKLGEYLDTIPLVIEKNLTAVKVARERENLQRQLQQKNAELEQALARVEELAATDPLTGLYNRRHFSKVLEQLFAEAQRYGHDLSCVMMDLDDYKQLNDSYGHQIGDQLLVLAAKVIQTNLRKMDVAARYGGDEFVLLLPHADATEAAAIIERIREQYDHASAAALGRDGGVCMSVGIASLRETRAVGGDQLVTRADAALYRDKDLARKRIASPPVSQPLAASL